MQTPLIPSLPLTMRVAHWAPGEISLISGVLGANLLHQSRPPFRRGVLDERATCLSVCAMVKSLNELTLLTAFDVLIFY